MVGITIDGKHSYYDYGLILASKTLEAPETKTMFVDVPGADGVLDMTDFFGDTKYNNRTLTFGFSKPYISTKQAVDDWTYLQDELHGKKVKITLDEDDEYYYIGRIHLEYTREKLIAQITMTVDAEPYKLKWKDTELSITGNGNINLYNNRKKVIPTITTTAETKIVFNDLEVNLNAGVHVVSEIELSSGDNVLTVTSTGNTTFKYKEGGF